MNLIDLNGLMGTHPNSVNNTGGVHKAMPVQHSKVYQVNKVKNIKDKLNKLLRKVAKCNSVSEVKKGTVGCIENRIDNISKMTEKLSEVVEQINEQKTSSAVREADEGARASGVGGASNRLQRRQDQKPRCRPLNISKIQNKAFDRYFVVRFNEQTKCQINPYALINRIKDVAGSPPKAVTDNNAVSFTVETQNADQSSKITHLKEVEGFPCEVYIHSRYSQSKGILYIWEFDMTNTEKFKKYLQEEYNIAEIIAASFIKTEDSQTLAFLITFNEEQPPYGVQSIYSGRETGHPRIPIPKQAPHVQ